MWLGIKAQHADVGEHKGFHFRPAVSLLRVHILTYAKCSTYRHGYRQNINLMYLIKHVFLPLNK